jgi:hypothetical protein
VLGVERFIIDDGWFKGRNDDHAALGDWYLDEKKYPKVNHLRLDPDAKFHAESFNVTDYRRQAVRVFFLICWRCRAIPRRPDDTSWCSISTSRRPLIISWSA